LRRKAISFIIAALSGNGISPEPCLRAGAYEPVLASGACNESGAKLLIEDS
jgi:hypothetical protein